MRARGRGARIALAIALIAPACAAGQDVAIRGGTVIPIAGPPIEGGTVLIRDDGPTCHVAWGLVFDPEPSDYALAEAERLLEVMSAQLGDLAAGRVNDDAGEEQTA